MNIIIRNETAADIEAINKVTVTAFLNAPHTEHTEQFIVKALRKADVLTVSLVAELDGQLVGHVAISPVTISDGAGKGISDETGVGAEDSTVVTGWYGLGPISVIPEHQGQGIGSALMKASLVSLEQCPAAGCVVLGDPALYKKFGFKPEACLVLPGVPAEYFQALCFTDELPTGEVTYHQGFYAQE